MFHASFGDLWADATVPKGSASGPADDACYRWDLVQQRQQLCDVVGVSVGQRHRLTQLLGAAPPSVSRLIDRLQAMGFVERGACPDSRREVLLSITPAGHVQLARVRELRDELLHQALADMSSRQRTALTEGLVSLQHTLLSQPALHLAQERATPAEGHRDAACSA